MALKCDSLSVFFFSVHFTSETCPAKAEAGPERGRRNQAAPSSFPSYHLLHHF